MNRRGLVLYGVLGLLSCRMLQKDKQQSSSLQRSDTQHLQQLQRQTYHQLELRDSSGGVYQLTIWPKGTFQFTAEQGFIGEAEKLAVTGNYRSARQQSTQTIQKTDSLSHMKDQQHVQQRHSVAQKNKAALPALAWISLAILLLLLAYKLRKVIPNCSMK